MTFILGISAYYHDSAACLLRDGKIVAAAQEKCFNRKKHDPRFPINATLYCLREAGISLLDLRYVVFYDKPLLKVDRLIDLCLAGGMALNCVGNGRILRQGPFAGIWMQPAAGDAGGALGAALAAWHQVQGKPRNADGVHDSMRGSFLGPSCQRKSKSFLIKKA